MPANFSVGEVLGTSFKTLARNFVPFATMTVLAYAPILVYTYVLASRDMVRTRELQHYEAIVFFSRWLINSALAAMLAYGVVKELQGQRAGIGACLGHGIRRALPALGVAIVADLAWIGGAFLLIVPGFMMLCMLYVAIPASVIERPGIRGALDRSRELTLGLRWPVFGLMTVMFGIWFVPFFITVGIVGQHKFAHLSAYLWAPMAIKMVASTLDAVVAAVAYYALRAAKEGSSVTALASVFE